MVHLPRTCASPLHWVRSAPRPRAGPARHRTARSAAGLPCATMVFDPPGRFDGARRARCDRRSVHHREVRLPTIAQLVRKGREHKTVKTKTPGAARRAPAARRVHPGVHHDPQEAQLGPAQGGPGPADQRRRGDRLHPRASATTCRSTPSSWSAAAGSRTCPGSATRSSAARSTPPGVRDRKQARSRYGAKRA